MAQCPICEVRKPKRYCTARGENICPQCCATNREVSINCPFECQYLRESRAHEKVERDSETLPHRDYEITEAFLRHADVTIMLFSMFLSRAAVGHPNLTDAEMREAVEAIVHRFRGNPLPELQGTPAEVYSHFDASFSKFRADLAAEQGASSVFNDRTLLGVAVFLARMAHGHNNGKPLCRAFVHFLRESFPAGDAA